MTVSGNVYSFIGIAQFFGVHNAIENVDRKPSAGMPAHVDTV